MWLPSDLQISIFFDGLAFWGESFGAIFLSFSRDFWSGREGFGSWKGRSCQVGEVRRGFIFERKAKEAPIPKFQSLKIFASIYLSQNILQQYQSFISSSIPYSFCKSLSLLFPKIFVHLTSEVVLLKNGRALELSGAVQKAQAIMVTWFLGMLGAAE